MPPSVFPRAVLLLLMSLPWIGCGPAPEVAPAILLQQLDNPDKGLVEEAVRSLARQAARDPERILPLLTRRLQALHSAQVAIAARVTPDLRSIQDPVERNDATIRLMRQLHQRLIQGGFTLAQVRQQDASIEFHVVPPADPTLMAFVRERLRAELARPGRIELRTEVPAPFEPTPERPRSPWAGDAASFSAWQGAEQRLFDAAGGDPTRYVPSRADVALVVAPAGPQADGRTAIPVLQPTEAAPALGEGDFQAGQRDDPATGVPSLYLVPQPGREEHVRRGLLAAAGLPLWVVEDGQALAVTRVPGRPGTALVFPMHGTTPAQARERAVALAARLTTGRLPYPVVVEDLEQELTVDPLHPICRAIVRTGPAAEPALEALLARDPAFAPLIKQLRDGILKVRTE